MKKYRLKDITKFSLLFIFTSLTLFSACQGGFVDINTDRDRVDTEDLNKDNLWAAYIQSMQLSVFSEDPNTYQLVDDMHGNVFSMYHGQAANWNNGNNPTNYYFDVASDYHGTPFEAAYGTIEKTDGKATPGIMNSWNTMRQRVDSTSITFGVGLTVKVAGMHRLTDLYGPIPYLGYGKTLYVPYDSQEDVYKMLFEELDLAIQIMTDFYTATPTSRPLARFDLIYDGDILKWIKFANSLKLRLAMRISYVEPELAKKYAEEAVNHKFGVMTANSETAKIKSSAVYPYENPLEQLWSDYGETRMGANMDSYLNGYNDPRIDKYFRATSNGKYIGMRNGMDAAASYRSLVSTPNITKSSPLYWLHAAEVYFLRAEGALRGWNMNGVPETLYNQGIEIAMSEFDIVGSEVTNYINNSTSVPAPYVDPKGGFSVLTGSPMLSTITIKWDESASFEQKLERIMTQKWIAMYPNGLEAWSEFRRTGYPKLFTPAVNKNTSNIPDGKYIKRLPLPASEFQKNKKLTEEAVTQYLNGKDSPGTRLWWDTTED